MEPNPLWIFNFSRKDSAILRRSSGDPNIFRQVASNCDRRPRPLSVISYQEIPGLGGGPRVWLHLEPGECAPVKSWSLYSLQTSRDGEHVNRECREEGRPVDKVRQRPRAHLPLPCCKLAKKTLPKKRRESSDPSFLVRRGRAISRKPKRTNIRDKQSYETCRKPLPYRELWKR